MAGHDELPDDLSQFDLSASDGSDHDAGEHDQEHSTAHGHQSHHAKHGGHGDHGGHGGGHGGSWLVTYCDMITLLMAFFICIMTFASQECGKADHRKLRDSVLYGTPGTGVAGPAMKPIEQDSYVWRKVLLSSNPAKAGSPVPPLYSDPTLDLTRRALMMLEEAPEVVLSDSYTVTVPVGMMFDDKTRLTSSARELLHVVANNIRTLPVDLHVQVTRSDQLPRALAITQYLQRQESMPPGRLGIGLAPGNELRADCVRMVFIHRPHTALKD